MNRLACLLLCCSLGHLLGGATEAHAQTRILTLNGGPGSGWFGDSVAIAGDMNGDGHDDLVVGAPASQPTTGGMGSVEVFSGATGNRLYYFPGRSLGRAVAAAGDVNGDGFADIVCGAEFNDEVSQGGGAAFVYSGFDGQILHEWHGGGGGGGGGGLGMGATVAGGGDVDADGFDDVIVSYGSLGFPGGGTRVFSGATGAILHTFPGFAGNSLTGSPVSDAGDVNGDGHDDIIMGGSYSGRAMVYSGADGSLLHSITAPLKFGDAVSGLGDINNDGFDDFVVGNPGSLGSASVYSGLNGQPIYTFVGDFALDEFGAALSRAGDVDGDGVPDIAVSAPGAGLDNDDKGYVRVFSGATGSIIYTTHGYFSFLNYGKAMCAGGDVNGDGIPDLIASSYRAGGAFVIGPSNDGVATVCVGRANSTGRGARLIPQSPSGFDVNANDTVLRVTGLPGGSPTLAMMIGSPGYGVIHRPRISGTFSNGTLCIAGGPIGRFNRPGELFFGGASVFDLPIDLLNIPWTDPTASPPYSTILQAGETWYFQCWYRDEAFVAHPAVTGGNSFSDAVRITFN